MLRAIATWLVLITPICYASYRLGRYAGAHGWPFWKIFVAVIPLGVAAYFIPALAIWIAS